LFKPKPEAERKIERSLNFGRQRINYKVIAGATSDDDVEIGTRGSIRTAPADCIA